MTRVQVPERGDGGRAEGQRASSAALVNEVVEAPGQEIEPQTRAAMERRLGFDFRHVRIHADETAADASEQLGAKAFTIGNHVAFGRGVYRPGSADAGETLQHELVHVVQQSAAGGQFQMGMPGDAYEREADTLSATAAPRRPALRTSGLMLQRALPPGGSTGLTEPSVLHVMDKVFDKKGIAYATEVKVELTVVDDAGNVITEIRRFDRAYTEAGDYIFVEAKGTDPNKLTDGQKLVDRLAQEKGATFKVVEVGGKPPGGVRVRTLAFAKGFIGKLKAGALQHVSGAIGGTPKATLTHSMDVVTWRAAMDQKYADVAPGSTAARYTKANTAPAQIPQQDVGKVTPPPKANPTPPGWMNKPLKPPTRVPPVDVVDDAVQATDPVIEPEIGGRASRPGRAGAAAAVEESLVVPKGGGSVPKPPAGTGAAAAEAGVVAEAEAAGVARTAGLGRALRIGGNIVTVVGLLVLHKVISDLEQAAAKADMDRIAPQIDARVQGLSTEILERQLEAPWSTVYIQTTFTETFTATEAAGSGFASLTLSYVDTQLTGVSLSGGPAGSSTSERKGERNNFAQGEASGAVYQVYRDITHIQACKRFTYDELLAYVNDLIAQAPDDQKDALRAKAAKLTQLKKEAQVRADKEKKKKEDELIARVEAPPVAQPSKVPSLLPSAAGDLTDKEQPSGVPGPFNLEKSPYQHDSERVDYLFVKRDRLVAMLDALKSDDAAAVAEFKKQRNVWGEQLKYLNTRLKTEQPSLAARLKELFDWVRNDGRRLWEVR